MGHKNAWEALTAPEPNDRQIAIVFIAERCKARFPFRNRAHTEDVSYILAVLLRWGWFTTGKRPDLGRMAYGRLISDCMSAWDILLGREVPNYGETPKDHFTKV